ncbi:putative Homeodomain-like, Homeodomain-related, SANT domain, DNA binding protein [Trachipleistophora hominis]|uniref:Putative Homeodomain-like, Homeodomain-related, SANT domain, DNA binding protein n=1 Tax=Trachipleistophora hominis TaxID=72359 RepID=L7JWH5_TRAHO|nr:putative Homeodomain-like, Homeodomain-related, SANT domain, DNA binding protein [Trachipleistophora hominis]
MTDKKNITARKRTSTKTHEKEEKENTDKEPITTDTDNENDDETQTSESAEDTYVSEQTDTRGDGHDNDGFSSDREKRVIFTGAVTEEAYDFENMDAPACSFAVQDYIRKYQINPQGITVPPSYAQPVMPAHSYLFSRKERTFWSATEIEYLRKGVQMFGCGRWKKIHKAYEEHFQRGRRPCDLKDKYRLLTKRTSYRTKYAKQFVQLDANHRKVDNVVYERLFPFEAAYDIAQLRGKDEMVIYLANAKSHSDSSGRYYNVHKYLVSIIEGKIKVSRIVEKAKK